MVKEIISQAQHILWAPAILLVLPPVALFTKKALCISSEYRKEHFCQEPKGMKRNPFFFRGSWRLWKSSCVLFLNWFPYPRPPEGGQASPANFLSGRATKFDRNTNHVPSSPTPTPLTLLPGTKTLTREGEEMPLRNRKQKKKFPYFFCAFPSSSAASKPATLCCAPGLINMNQTGNDQREWEISKG